MDAITISAKFAAYTWFTKTLGEKNTSPEAAAAFAEASWERFLDHADKGLGRLLVRLDRKRRARRRKTLPFAAAV